MRLINFRAAPGIHDGIHDGIATSCMISKALNFWCCATRFIPGCNLAESRKRLEFRFSV